MTSPLDRLKERLGKIEMFGVESGDDWINVAEDAIRWAEAYRKGWAKEVGYDHQKTYDTIDPKAAEILNSKEG